MDNAGCCSVQLCNATLLQPLRLVRGTDLTLLQPSQDNPTALHRSVSSVQAVIMETIFNKMDKRKVAKQQAATAGPSSGQQQPKVTVEVRKKDPVHSMSNDTPLFET